VSWKGFVFYHIPSVLYHTQAVARIRYFIPPKRVAKTRRRVPISHKGAYIFTAAYDRRRPRSFWTLCTCISTSMATMMHANHIPPESDLMVQASPSHTGSTINPPSQSSRSRENTPSTVSSHSIDTALQRTTSGTSADASSGSSLGQSSQSTRNEEDMEKFLKKMDMEKVR